MRLAWLEAFLNKAGVRPLTPKLPRTFQDLAYYQVMYNDVTKHPAWSDFMSIMKRIRNGSLQALEAGVLDKQGKNHDDELRVVIHTLNTLLNHVAALQADYNKAESNLRKVHNIPQQPQEGMFV
jgi:hypothetical protein